MPTEIIEATDQLDDGGWDVNFRSASPAGTLDWRGYATVSATRLLRANGRIRERVSAQRLR
jgi:hypothetical protein